jgi:hypothetical protein
MAAKLDIGRELRGVNDRNHDFYKNLTDEEKKAFSPYLLMRYVSNPQVDSESYEFILGRVNDLVNINHWTLSKGHKAFLWQLFASCGLGMPVKYTYLKASSKEKANKIEKLLEELHPAMKLSDIKVLASMMDDKDKQELFDKMGFDKKQRKEYE